MVERFVITSILMAITVIATFYMSVMILYESSLSTEVTLNINLVFNESISNLIIEPSNVKLNVTLNTSSGVLEYKGIARISVLGSDAKEVTLKLKRMDVSSFNINTLPIRLKLLITDHGGLTTIDIPIGSQVLSRYLSETIVLQPGTYNVSLSITWSNLYGLGYLDLGYSYLIEVSD